MSEPQLILPPGVSLPERIQPKDAQDENIPADQKAKSLPEPTGWKILCVVPDVADTFEFPVASMDIVPPASNVKLPSETVLPRKTALLTMLPPGMASS